MYMRKATDTASNGTSRSLSKPLWNGGGAELDRKVGLHREARWRQMNEIPESMLSMGGFQKEAILF